MQRRRFLRAIPAGSIVAALGIRLMQPAEAAAEKFVTAIDHKGYWGTPGAVWQLVTHEFGQTWMRVR